MYSDPQEILDILKVDRPNLTLDDVIQIIVYGETTAKRVCDDYDREVTEKETKQNAKSTKLQKQHELVKATMS